MTKSGKKPNILVVYNSYLNKGGEDSVVHNEIQTLKKHHFHVLYKEYDNTAFKAFKLGSVFIPLNIFFNFSVFFNTFFSVIRNKIDVVHVHNVFYTVSPSVFWAAKLAGARTIYTVHNYRLFCLNGLFFLNGHICTHCHDTNSFQKGIKNKCFKQSRLFSRILAISTNLHRTIGSWRLSVDLFMAINPFIAELLVQRGIDRKKIYLKTNYSQDFGFKNYDNREDFYFFAGRLQAEKGVQYMVEGFQILQKKLLIAGSGELKEWVKEHQTAAINYIGHQSGQEMQRLYLKCKAVIFPSIWLEGMPMAIIEAQSAGAIPIVASTETTRAMISHQENGLLYEAGNMESLINTIIAFESMTVEELNKISNNARRKFVEDYNEEQHIRIIEKIYN